MILLLLQKTTNIKCKTKVNNSQGYVMLAEFVMFCRSYFVPLRLAIVLSVLLRYIYSDYPFSIFILLLFWLSCVDALGYKFTCRYTFLCLIYTVLYDIKRLENHR